MDEIFPEHSGRDVQDGVVGTDETIEFFAAVAGNFLGVRVEEVTFQCFDPEVEVPWWGLETFGAMVRCVA